MELQRLARGQVGRRQQAGGEALGPQADRPGVGQPRRRRGARLAAGLLPRPGEVPEEALRFHDRGEANFPWVSDGRWFLAQFRRWGWLAHAEDGDAWLADVYRRDLWAQAARLAGVAVPAQDTRPDAPVALPA